MSDYAPDFEDEVSNSTSQATFSSTNKVDKSLENASTVQVPSSEGAPLPEGQAAPADGVDPKNDAADSGNPTPESAAPQETVGEAANIPIGDGTDATSTKDDTKNDHNVGSNDTEKQEKVKVEKKDEPDDSKANETHPVEQSLNAPDVVAAVAATGIAMPPPPPAEPATIKIGGCIYPSCVTSRLTSRAGNKKTNRTPAIAAREMRRASFINAELCRLSLVMGKPLRPLVPSSIKPILENPSAAPEPSGPLLEIDCGKTSLYGLALSDSVEELLKYVRTRCEAAKVSSEDLVNTPGFLVLGGRAYGLKCNNKKYTLGLGARATPLQFAAAFGNAPIAKALVELGAKDEPTSLPKPSAIATTNGYTLFEGLLKGCLPFKSTNQQKTL